MHDSVPTPRDSLTWVTSTTPRPSTSVTDRWQRPIKLVEGTLRAVRDSKKTCQRPLTSAATVVNSEPRTALPHPCRWRMVL